jgi:hypothetical protein
MGADGSLTDPEPPRNFTIGVVLCDKLENFVLSLAQQ